MRHTRARSFSWIRHVDSIWRWTPGGQQLSSGTNAVQTVAEALLKWRCLWECSG
jgi:hypothetical protein